MLTGPVTPRVPEEGKLRANSRGLGPPHRGPGPPTCVEPAYRRGGVRGRHVSRGRGSSAGRLAPPTVEACSAAAARGAAFVRSHCRPRITEVHSTAACAASAQSPSAALIGYDGTTLFHHAAYAASYTAHSATLQATPQATPWRRFDKTGHGYAGRRIPAGRQGNPGMRSPPATP